LLVLAAVMGLGGCSTTTADGHATPTVTLGTVPADTQPVTSASSSSSSNRASTTAPSAPARQPLAAPGAHLLIPRLDINAPIVAVGVQKQEMDVPLDPRTLGWWTGGAVPGSGRGSIVIDGHINYAGVSGALAVLPDLKLGDTVSLTRPGHTLTYTVQAVRTYSKDSGLPQDAFSQSTAERLVLITCGGPFDASTGNYEDNIVAYATPTAA
jgi:LPXTG-site transpeptidase (sortase) family protein